MTRTSDPDLDLEVLNPADLGPGPLENLGLGPESGPEVRGPGPGPRGPEVNYARQ